MGKFEKCSSQWETGMIRGGRENARVPPCWEIAGETGLLFYCQIQFPFYAVRCFIIFHWLQRFIYPSLGGFENTAQENFQLLVMLIITARGKELPDASITSSLPEYHEINICNITRCTRLMHDNCKFRIPTLAKFSRICLKITSPPIYIIIIFLHHWGKKYSDYILLFSISS